LPSSSAGRAEVLFFSKGCALLHKDIHAEAAKKRCHTIVSIHLGCSINPSERTYLEEMIQTGISTIGVMKSIARGQKNSSLVCCWASAQGDCCSDMSSSLSCQKAGELWQAQRGVDQRFLIPSRVHKL